MPRIRVAACQINTVVGDLDGNVDRILGALAEAERAGADLAVFPELTVTGYPPEDLLGRPAFVEDNLSAFAAVAAAHGGVDVILDMVAGPYFPKNLEALNTGGRLVHIASQAGAVVELPIMKIMQKRLIITGSTLRPRNADEKARIAAAVERVVWPWIEAGQVKPIIDRTFPLAEAAAAHARLEAGGHVGKVVLTV